MASYRNVLVAFDGSEMSTRALECAVDIARTSGARLLVLAVAENAPPFAAAVAENHKNGRLRSAVESALGTARRAGVSADATIVDGYPAEVIVRNGAELDCDLIVVGAPADGECRPGRTADKVVELARSAVLVVR